MTKGLERREAASDNLAGKPLMEPVMLRGPGLQQPRQVSIDTSSASSKVANQLLQWGSGKLAEAAEKDHERRKLDGQMAYQQGKTFEEVEMGGDKWALEGYRLMDAQTMASSMLAAQREKIQQGDYALDPDAFREQYVNRLDGMLEGVDKRTARLVREQMASQMPTLVSDHTQAHMTHLEQQNYDSLERSIEVVSRDPTAADTLVMIAEGGEGSPSAGLSGPRRQAAVTEGVIRAFDNDNPLAFSTLKKAGLLGDNLSTQEQNAIKAAQQRFENRLRTNYNEDLFNGMQEITRRIEVNDLSPSEAVEELSVLYADHGIKMNAADAGEIYSEALKSERTGNMTAATNFEEARLRGDYKTMARITTPIIVQVESGGDPNAVSPTGAKGLMQVLDSTNADPGYGVEPARDNSPEERVRVGEDYWQTMLGGKDAHSILLWEAGDLEAAALAYNQGPGVANEWIKSGRDMSILKQEGRDYIKKVTSRLANWKAPTAAHRLSIAQQQLEETRKRLALDTYEQVAPRLAELDDMFKKGDIKQGAWQERRQHIYAEYDYARTMADVNHEVGVIREVNDALAIKSQKAADDDYTLRKEAASAAIMPAKLAWEDIVNDPASTPEQIMMANHEFAAAQKAIMDDHGIMAVDRGTGPSTENMLRKADEAIKANRVYMEEQAQIDAAVNGRYLGKLSPKLQERAFEDFNKRAIQEYSREVQEGRMTEQEANFAMTQDANAFYAQAGKVPDQLRMQATAAFMGELVDKDGNPSPMAVDALGQYAQIKSMNPAAADTMLDPEAMVIAEAALSRASNPNMYGEAIRNIGLEVKNGPLIQDTREYMARPDVQERIDREVTNYLEERDIGLLHAWWQNDAEYDQLRDRNYVDQERLWSEENKQFVHDELAHEVSRLQKINGNLKPRDLVAKAAENLTNRLEIIGGDAVPLPPGQSWNEKFFGSRAVEFDHDGAVNSAVMEWLRSDEVKEQYGFVDDFTGAEMLPGWLQSTIDFGARVLPGDLSFDPAMSRYEAVDARHRGVRPFRAGPVPGGGLFVQILKPDGNWSDTIVVDTERAGEMYMERRRLERTK